MSILNLTFSFIDIHYLLQTLVHFSFFTPPNHFPVISLTLPQIGETLFSLTFTSCYSWLVQAPPSHRCLPLTILCLPLMPRGYLPSPKHEVKQQYQSERLEQLKN